MMQPAIGVNRPHRKAEKYRSKGGSQSSREVPTLQPPFVSSHPDVTLHRSTESFEISVTLVVHSAVIPLPPVGLPCNPDTPPLDVFPWTSSCRYLNANLANDSNLVLGLRIGLAMIFPAGCILFFPSKVDDLFSHRPQYTG